MKKYIKQIEKTLLKISKKLKSFSEIRSFIIVGSYPKEISSCPNDVDCIVITNKSLSSSVKNKIHNQLAPYNINYSDDSVRLRLNSVEFGLTYIKSKKFYSQIKSLISGHALSIRKKDVTWAVGGNLPEVMLSDLSRCRIVFDKDNLISSIKSDLLKQYPKALKVNLIDSLNCEIQTKISLIDRYLKQSNAFMAKVGISDVAIAVYRLIHVNNNLYPLGLKHIQHYDYLKTKNGFSGLIKDLLETSESDNLEENISRLKEIYRKI